MNHVITMSYAGAKYGMDMLGVWVFFDIFLFCRGWSCGPSNSSIIFLLVIDRKESIKCSIILL